MLLEYSGNITSRLLEYAKRSTFIIIKSYTFSTKTTFPSITFQKHFFLKIFTKCSLDVPHIARLREHSANIPGIMRVGRVQFCRFFKNFYRKVPLTLKDWQRIILSYNILEKVNVISWCHDVMTSWFLSVKTPCFFWNNFQVT